MRFVNASTELRAERGSASLELITLGTLLLVPLVYLILSVAALQAGALAAEGAARQAARSWVLSGSESAADSNAAASITVAAADFGFESDQVSWNRICTAPCLSPGSRVTVEVVVQVPLPLLPMVFGGPRNTPSVPMHAQATQTVSRFAGTGR